MKAAIITIGDELLIGQTINTNLAKIGQMLSHIGINVLKSTTIKDLEADIINSLNTFLTEVDIVIITGGLGPTNDDITKETLSKYFHTKLVLNEEVLMHVRSIFESKGQEMLPVNIHQAMVPEDATVLENPLGTAPGMLFNSNGKYVFSLPGVPYELVGLLENKVIPYLKRKFNLNGKYYQTIMLQGIGESFLAEKIQDWETRIYAADLHLAYLPSPGLIRLRITSDNGREDASKIEQFIGELEAKLPEYVYGRNEINLFQKVGDILQSKQLTVGTVESCTGGGIANSFVLNPGSSEYFAGGLITYSNSLKTALANVSPESIARHGAVSEEVAKEMSLGGRKQLGVDYCIAVTGIAGPSGGSTEKPVGTVWVAVSSSKGVVAKKFLFGKNRERNIVMTQLSAVNLLRHQLLNIK